MTGHRRATGKPLARIATARRRAAHADHRITTATTPKQQVTAVLDYARAVVTNTPPDTARRIADRVTQVVLTETRAALAATQHGRCER